MFSILFVIWIFFESYGKKFLTCLHIMSEEKDVEVNEGLGNYWACVPAYRRKCMVAEEAYRRKKLEIKTMEECNFEKMRATAGLKKTMLGPSTYNLIMDQRYIMDFAFTPVEFRNEEVERDLSNIIT